jgi:hypothetical protein
MKYKLHVNVALTLTPSFRSTQEIELPTHLQLLIGQFVLDGQALDALRIISSPLFSSYEKANISTYMNTITGKERLKGKSLMNILHALPNRHCELRRDRLYSILSLASEGPSITVDYGSSDRSVFFQVMRACEKSVCICSAIVVASDMVWEPLLDSSLQRETIKTLIHTHATPRNSGPSDNSIDRCSACHSNMPTLSASGPGHLFCLQDICSSIDGFHLYLSTAGPTEGKILSVEHGLSHPRSVGDDVSIKHVTDRKLFRIEFDPLGDFCQTIYDSVWRYYWQLCKQSQNKMGKFTVRALSHSKNEPYYVEPQPNRAVSHHHAESEHIAVES